MCNFGTSYASVHHGNMIGTVKSRVCMRSARNLVDYSSLGNQHESYHWTQEKLISFRAKSCSVVVHEILITRVQPLSRYSPALFLIYRPGISKLHTLVRLNTAAVVTRQIKLLSPLGSLTETPSEGGPKLGFWRSGEARGKWATDSPLFFSRSGGRDIPHPHDSTSRSASSRRSLLRHMSQTPQPSLKWLVSRVLAMSNIRVPDDIARLFLLTRFMLSLLLAVPLHERASNRPAFRYITHAHMLILPSSNTYYLLFPLAPHISSSRESTLMVLISRSRCFSDEHQNDYWSFWALFCREPRAK